MWLENVLVQRLHRYEGKEMSESCHAQHVRRVYKRLYFGFLDKFIHELAFVVEVQR